MKNKSSILFAVLVWSLLLVRFGYRFGTGDQVELLPYTLYLYDTTLYEHDFFIQGLNASVPNERTVMAHLLLPFVNHLELLCFLLQFLSTIILILGLETLARRFIQHKYLAWFAILAALIPLNDYTLGNVELYSECFQASALAVAIVVWAINLFLDRKYLVASVLLSLATFIQLLEGLDVMLVLSAVLLVAVIKKEVSLKNVISFLSIYAITSGVYLVLIFVQKNVSSEISNQELFKILFEFRHPHHFVFSSFPKFKTIVFALLAISSVIFFRKRSSTLFQFILVSCAGIIFYIVAVDGLHNILIGNFQFYKITQWLKLLGVVSIVGLAEGLLFKKTDWLNQLKFETGILLTGLLASWLVIICFQSILPYHVRFQIFGLKEKDDAVSICEQIKMNTPKDAVFIQPFDNTELKFHAQRSSYVEFKANVRNKLFVREWANRVEEVFHVNSEMKEKGFTLQQKEDGYFYHLDKTHLDLLKQKGVTHILTRKEFPPAEGTLILSNNTYAVYQL
ncbi:MAG: hypothetical protein NTY88_13000 [Bacteroidetes bacterium]|nr:hypothetical protein [Bacteroidota bacterium]